MTQYVINIINDLGIFGLFTSMAFEGSSVPFPGIIIVLTYGYLLHPSIPEIMLIAFGMSITYSIASFIPYAIGWKLEEKIKKRYQTKMEKAQQIFKKYGEWSVALTRPFGIGNYISYVAGMSRIKPLKYGLLTLIGIFPWSFTMLLLGRMYKGNTNAVMSLLGTYKWYIYAGLALIVIGYFILAIYRKRNNAMERG